MDNTRRVAGWSAIVAAALYLLQPVIVALNGLAGAEEQDFLLPSQVRSIWWSGAVQALLMIAIGVAFLALVTGTGAILRDRMTSVWQQVAHTMGLLCGVGWLLAAAMGLAGYSTVAAFMAESGADEGAQKAALHMVNVTIEAFLALAAVGVAGWLVSLSIVGRRLGMIGPVLSVAGLVVAGAGLITTLIGFPLGLLLLIPYLPFLGVRLLRDGGAQIAVIQEVAAS